MKAETAIARTACQRTMAGRLRTPCAARLLPLLLLLALPAVVKAQFAYEVTNGTITITGYNGPGGVVVIPSAVNGVPVVGIGDNAFLNCTRLAGVTIPNSVTNIGEYAFSGCSLTGVTVPNSVTSLGDGAFDSCTRLTAVTIPNSVTSIGDNAFSWCSSLTSVTLPSGVTSIGDSAFYDCTGLTSVTIPNSVTTIGDSVFCWCTSLTSVTMGSGVTSIGDRVFSWCTSLTSVTLPSGVTSIGDSAFYDCTGLTQVTIPSTVTSIGNGAFCQCSSLTSLAIPSGVTSIGESMFAYCTSLTNATIPNRVTHIGDSAFSGCTSLASVTIGNSVTSIGDQAFADCGNLLTGVYFEGDAPSAGSDVFLGDNYLTLDYLPGAAGWGAFFAERPAVLWNSAASLEVTIGPPGAVSAGAQWQVDGGMWQNSGATVHFFWAGSHTVAFSTVSGWITPTSQGVKVGANQTTMAAGTYMPVVNSFNYTTNSGTITITGYTGPGGAVTIPDRIPDTTGGLPVTSIGDQAFLQRLSLTSVTIPNTVTNIGDEAFDECASLSSVTFGNSVTSIGSGAFSGTSLTTVTIPNSVTSIGDDAFYSCTSLTSVYFQGNAPSLGGGVFAFDDNATVYYLPGSTGWSDFSTNAGLPVVLWTPQVETSNASFGVRTNQFGFTINWASGMNVVVEASANLAAPIWYPLATNTLTGGSSYFSDPQWTNHPARFYRLRWP
jgi:hypothetical protein